MNITSIMLGSSQYERFAYPGGEIQVRFTNQSLIERLKTVEIVSVLARITKPEHIIELALLSDAIAGINEKAKKHLVLPYMPYARADRRFVDGDCLGIAAMARMIFAMSFLEVSTLDIHSKATDEWVGGFRNVAADKLIEEAINKFATVCGSHAINVLLPDEGAVGRYAIPATTGCNTFGIDVAVFNATKKRDAVTGKLSGFEVPKMPSHPTIIVDDICDGGGTFVGIAEQLTDISELALYTTHGIYSKGLDPLKKWFKYIYTTSSFRTVTDYQKMYDFDPSLTVMNCLPEFDF